MGREILILCINSGTAAATNTTDSTDDCNSCQLEYLTYRFANKANGLDFFYIMIRVSLPTLLLLIETVSDYIYLPKVKELLESAE